MNLNKFKLIYLAIIGFTIIPRKCSSLNILQVVPGFSTSHAIFNYRIAKSLISHGHNVTLVTVTHFLVVKVEPPQGAVEYRIHSEIDKETQETILNISDRFVFQKTSIFEFINFVKHLSKSWVASCEKLLDNEVIISNLREQGFDVAMLHFFDGCPLFLTNILGIKKIMWLSPANFILDYVAQAMRIPSIPSFIPNGLIGYSDSMTFMERVKNAGLLAFFTLSSKIPSASNHFQLEEKNFRLHPNEERPTMLDLFKSVSLLNINGEPFIDFPRPMPIGCNYLGEMGVTLQANRKQTSEKPLGEPWTSILARENKGIILFSLGTVANTTNMPDYMRDAFLEAFKKFTEYSIIWRIEKNVPGIEHYKHIKVTKWIPQRQLLNDPKLKLFITHGGYNSLLETTKAGVPVVMLPLFGDQFPNSKRAEMRHLGVTLDKLTLTGEDVENAINAVITDEKYAKNAKKLAAEMDHKLVSPDKLLSRRLEIFSKASWYPGLTAAQRLNYFQYLCLDVIATFSVLFVSFLIIVVKLTRISIRALIENGKNKK